MKEVFAIVSDHLKATLGPGAMFFVFVMLGMSSVMMTSQADFFLSGDFAASVGNSSGECEQPAGTCSDDLLDPCHFGNVCPGNPTDCNGGLCPVCGDGMINQDEETEKCDLEEGCNAGFACTSDCSECIPVFYCGDETCNGGETAASCPADCGGDDNSGETGDTGDTGDEGSSGDDGPTDLCLGVVCTASDQCHAAGVCDPATGHCSDPPKPDHVRCYDDDLCSLNDTCIEGSCTPGPIRNCNSDARSCYLKECKAETGQCDFHNPIQAKDDGTACTMQDNAAGVCNRGLCKKENDDCDGDEDCPAMIDECNEGFCNTVTHTCESRMLVGRACQSDRLYCSGGPGRCMTNYATMTAVCDLPDAPPSEKPYTGSNHCIKNEYCSNDTNSVGGHWLYAYHPEGTVCDIPDGYPHADPKKVDTDNDGQLDDPITDEGKCDASHQCVPHDNPGNPDDCTLKQDIPCEHYINNPIPSENDGIPDGSCVSVPDAVGTECGNSNIIPSDATCIQIGTKKTCEADPANANKRICKNPTPVNCTTDPVTYNDEVLPATPKALSCALGDKTINCCKNLCDQTTGKCKSAPDRNAPSAACQNDCDDATQDVDCFDGNPCTTDECKTGVGWGYIYDYCENAPLGNGASCSGADKCSQYQCNAANQCNFVPNSQVQCPSPGVCQTPVSCNATSGNCPPLGDKPDGVRCQYPFGTATLPGTCRSGVCMPGDDDGPNCDDGNQCTDDALIGAAPNQYCVHPRVEPAPAGCGPCDQEFIELNPNAVNLFCNDNDRCTDDSCGAGNVCNHSPNNVCECRADTDCPRVVGLTSRCEANRCVSSLTSQNTAAPLTRASNQTPTSPTRPSAPAPGSSNPDLVRQVQQIWDGPPDAPTPVPPSTPPKQQAPDFSQFQTFCFSNAGSCIVAQSDGSNCSPFSNIYFGMEPNCDLNDKPPPIVDEIGMNMPRSPSEQRSPTVSDYVPEDWPSEPTVLDVQNAKPVPKGQQKKPDVPTFPEKPSAPEVIPPAPDMPEDLLPEPETMEPEGELEPEWQPDMPTDEISPEEECGMVKKAMCALVSKDCRSTSFLGWDCVESGETASLMKNSAPPRTAPLKQAKNSSAPSITPLKISMDTTAVGHGLKNLEIDIRANGTAIVKYEGITMTGTFDPVTKKITGRIPNAQVWNITLGGSGQGNYVASWEKVMERTFVRSGSVSVQNFSPDGLPTTSRTVTTLKDGTKQVEETNRTFIASPMWPLPTSIVTTIRKESANGQTIAGSDTGSKWYASYDSSFNKTIEFRVDLQGPEVSWVDARSTTYAPGTQYNGEGGATGTGPLKDTSFSYHAAQNLLDAVYGPEDIGLLEQNAVVKTENFYGHKEPNTTVWNNQIQKVVTYANNGEIFEPKSVWHTASAQMSIVRGKPDALSSEADDIFIRLDSQTVLPGVTARYGAQYDEKQVDIVDYGMIFTLTNGSRKIVDYPQTDTVVLDSKNYRIGVSAAGVVSLTLIPGPALPPPPPGNTQCSDQQDNNHNGPIDMADPACVSLSDNSEGGPFGGSSSHPSAGFCGDGIVTAPEQCDFGHACATGPCDYTDCSCESVGNGGPECSDGIDNDRDGKIDDPADLGCTNPGDTSEAGGQADLILTVQAPAVAYKGQTLQYTVTLSAPAGGSPSEGVEFSFSKPEGFTLNSAQSNPNCVAVSTASPVILCGHNSPITVTAGASQQFRIVLDPGPSVTCPRSMLGSATITVFTQDDPNLANNTAQSQATALDCNSAGSAPKGYLDQGISGCEMVQGWSCDGDNYGAANDVHIYDGPAEQGNILGVVKADRPREAAIGTQCGDNNNHGFRFIFPSSFRDGREHKVYAYGINIGVAGNNTHLQTSPWTVRCFGTTACSDGRDNDGDGLIDLTDKGCTSTDDNDESNPAPEPSPKPPTTPPGPTPQCRDGYDNDQDNLKDYPQDPGCATADDSDERDANPVIPQCSDGRDNDGDGKIDLAEDPGCTSTSDNNEANPQCSDGQDNDGDLKTDYPADPGCSSTEDNLEEQNMKLPIGNFDGARSCSVLFGWACDEDTPQKALAVEISYYSAQGILTYLGAAAADKPREAAVGGFCGTNNHGFEFPFPAFLKDGRAHQFRISTRDSYNHDYVGLPPGIVTVTCNP